ncbi:MAG: hypothetical protein K6T80_04775 [Firmicutes bacterium]|nr:hypothetical protein [Bacillota bacterium]
MGGISDYDEMRLMEDKIKAARREVREIQALKRVVDFFGNPVHDLEGNYMYLSDMYRIVFFSGEQARKYRVLDDTVDVETVRRLFGE